MRTSPAPDQMRPMGLVPPELRGQSCLLLDLFSASKLNYVSPKYNPQYLRMYLNFGLQQGDGVKRRLLGWTLI